MIYLIFFVASCLLINIINKKEITLVGSRNCHNINRYLILFALIIPCVLAGARASSVGVDVQTYVISCFERVSNYTSFRQVINEHYLEVLYETLAYVASKISNDVHCLHFFSAAIIVIGFYCLAVQFKTKAPIELIMMAFYCFYFCQSLNTVRQWIAIGISCIAGRYLINQKPLRYFILATVAIGFHSSAIILYFLYFIYKFAGAGGGNNDIIQYRTESTVKKDPNNDLKKLLITILLSIVVALLFEPILKAGVYSGLLPSKYLNYLSSTDGQASIIMLVLQKSPFVIGIALFGRDLIRLDDRNRALIVFTLIDCVLGLLSSRYGYASRISLYFSIWEMILIVQFYTVIKDRIRDVMSLMLVNIGFYGLLIAYWYYCYIYRGFGMAYPYVSDIVEILNLK